MDQFHCDEESSSFFVDCPYTRNITRLKPLAAQKLQSHILALLSVVNAEFLTKFGIVFDGWMEETHQ